MKIYNRYTNEVLFALENAISVKDVVLAAMKVGAYLRGANLEGAYLRGANLYQVSGIGSAGRCTTYDLKNDKIICSCWYGSLEEFKSRVEEVYPNGKFGDQYRAAIAFFEAIKNNA